MKIIQPPCKDRLFRTARNPVLITGQGITHRAIFESKHIADTEIHCGIAATHQWRYTNAEINGNSTADIYSRKCIKLSAMTVWQTSGEIAVGGRCRGEIAKCVAVLVADQAVFIVRFHIEINQFCSDSHYFFGT